MLGARLVLLFGRDGPSSCGSYVPYYVDQLDHLPDNLYLKNLTEIRKKQLKPEDIITQTGSGKVGESIQFSSHIFWLKR